MIKIPFKKIDINIVLNVLLGSLIITLLLITSMTLFGLLYFGDGFSNLFGYVSTASLITASIMAGSFVLYFALTKKTKSNYWLLIAAATMIVVFITASMATTYLQSNPPAGPGYAEVSKQYESFIKQGNSKEEAQSKLVLWLNTQENVKDAQIKTNGISGGKEVFFSVHSFGVSTYDQSYPLEGLESMSLYTDCASSCPPEGTDNYGRCLSACQSSLGGE